MDYNEKRKLIHRFLSGYVFIGQYIIDTPSPNILVEADYIYDNCIYNNRFEDMIDQSHTEFFLLKNGLWSINDKNTLEQLPKRIENAKVNLYKNINIPSQSKRIRSHLDGLKEEYNKLMFKVGLFDQYTIQSLANYERELFIFSKIILNRNYEPIRPKATIIERIINEFRRQEPTNKIYREIARSGDWLNVWSTSGINSFRIIGNEQRQLISYTQMYENINKHPESPSDAVINDDDALDGWIIYMKEEHDREKKQQDFSKTKTKHDGREQFVMVQNREDAENILSMNDTRGKIIQKKIHSMVEKEGVANEFNIQEIRQDAIIKNRNK